MMTTPLQIKGRLNYLGWAHPWNVTPQDELGSELGPFDIKPLFWTFADRWKDQLCDHDAESYGYELKRDDSSKYKISFAEIGAGILLTRADGGFGFSNITADLDGALMRLNGRHVILDTVDTSFKISADPDHPVFGVKHHGSGNYAQIPAGNERDVCKVGTTEACLFLIAGSRGFECAKFSPSTARMLLRRKAENSIRATRIGDCEVTGRVDQAKGGQ
ncbi:hypothetical protein [Bradyrhizobium cenepequi]